MTVATDDLLAILNDKTKQSRRDDAKHEKPWYECVSHFGSQDDFPNLYSLRRLKSSSGSIQKQYGSTGTTSKDMETQRAYVTAEALLE